jgi:NAD(P)-dependent dehydrogenase (short-subunit alcohol dehydrogenase family)
MNTAVITGGTRGIGASLTNDFLKCGWNVVFSGTTVDSVKNALTSLSHFYKPDFFEGIICNVSKRDDLENLWEKAVQKFGRVDIWVNNAGRSNDQQLFHLIDPEVFRTYAGHSCRL